VSHCDGEPTACVLSDVRNVGRVVHEGSRSSAGQAAAVCVLVGHLCTVLTVHPRTQERQS